MELRRQIFEEVVTCSVSRARAGLLRLPHGTVETPVFMPVGTQGTMKGVTPEQVKAAGVSILLGNTYHLGHRPGPELLRRAGGLHKLMGWDGPILTDSGGFQMVSLAKLSEVGEEGVRFESPHDGSEMLLTPEHSMELQNDIGADIIMQLDDVVHRPRVEEAMWRSIRWLDRCIAAHRRNDQYLFAIVQGGLDEQLRSQCAQQMVKRNVAGYAIGGLAGGEDKAQFWRMVALSTGLLPREQARYCMGVGFAVDLVVCVALGCDITARFGRALTWTNGGEISLKNQSFANDFRPLVDGCSCYTCRHYTRFVGNYKVKAYINQIVNRETVACHLLTIHNLHYQCELMKRIRQAIVDGSYPAFVRRFLHDYFAPKSAVPGWISEALSSVGISLDERNI